MTITVDWDVKHEIKQKKDKRNKLNDNTGTGNEKKNHGNSSYKVYLGHKGNCCLKIFFFFQHRSNYLALLKDTMSVKMRNLSAILVNQMDTLILSIRT